MELQSMVDKLIAILYEKSNDNEEFSTKYHRMADDLKSMVQEIDKQSFPDDLHVLPMFRYIDVNLDGSQIYDMLSEINNWYIENYRIKDETINTRELLLNYLLEEYSMSEIRAKEIISEMAVHRDIYKEFVYYVKNRKFKDPALVIEGYNAQMLNENYPLSIVGAYNYLVYLREEPQNALADLKAGLPRR